MDYSLKANVKQKEGPSHPDRDEQFKYIDLQVEAFRAAGQPIISVDRKKKELVGDLGCWAVLVSGSGASQRA